jgi:serine protease
MLSAATAAAIVPGPGLAEQAPTPRALALERIRTDRALAAAIADARAGASARADIVPGLLAVKFADAADTAALSALAVRHGASRIVQPRYADFHLITIDPSRDAAAAASALAASPGVVYAEPVGRMYAFHRPNDPLYQYQWNLQQLDFERAWEINRGSEKAVVVAVIDTGVAYRALGDDYQPAPDLAGTTFVEGYDFIWEDDTPVDFGGHGTHVTGTVAQSTDNNFGVAGIAFNASIMPVKAISSEVDEILGAPNFGTTATVAEGIRFAIEHGAKVINLSLGGTFASTALRDAVQFAVDSGAVVVMAAGNSGDEGSPPFYPAVYAKDIEGAIAVSATDFDRTRAPYSNVNDYVELAAPGGNTDVDRNGDGFADGVLQQTIDVDAALETGRFDQFSFQFQQGTSMAAPHVSGLVALLMDQGITDPAAIEAALKRFATDLGPSGRDDEYGYGLINPRATLRGLGLAR